MDGKGNPLLKTGKWKDRAMTMETILANATLVLPGETLRGHVRLSEGRITDIGSGVGIPDGAVLHFTEGASIVTVIGERKVQLDGAEMSLTAATRQLLGLDYSVAPGPYWTYEGRVLRDIYNATYSRED